MSNKNIRKPRVNRRTVDLNAFVSSLDKKKKPTDADAITVAGFERSIKEYSEIGTAWLKRENTK